MEDLFKNNRRVFDPFKSRVKTHAWDKEVAPGVTAVGTPGHSIGHTSYMIQSGGERLFLIQDVSNHPAASLHNPGWHLSFDQDPVMAEKTRRKTLDWLAAEKIPVQAFHFPFPGRAYIEKTATGYRAAPIS
jgi:glyoxylase-like metal-dependent hydrolase (beta-lactamase superfamily II)